MDFAIRLSESNRFLNGKNPQFWLFKWIPVKLMRQCRYLLIPIVTKQAIGTKLKLRDGQTDRFIYSDRTGDGWKPARRQCRAGRARSRAKTGRDTWPGTQEPVTGHRNTGLVNWAQETGEQEQVTEETAGSYGKHEAGKQLPKARTSKYDKC